jgi:hypothetical protein
MKTIHLSIATLLILFTFLACSNSSKNENTEPSFADENVTLSIYSSNPDSTVIFEAINNGEWNGAAPADSQATPFEFTVSTTNFYGTFHKLEGNSALVIRLMAQENGETTWEINKEFNQIAQVILDENFTSINGK